MHNIKNKILQYISSYLFSMLLICTIFFFAWVDLLAGPEIKIIFWVLNFGVSVIIGIPVMLLIGAVFLKSPIAFGSTMAIFTIIILNNLSELPAYILLYISNPEAYSCNPLYEIISILEMILGCVFAILLMNRASFMAEFRWSHLYSLRVMIVAAIIYIVDYLAN
jgi:hypothetical protein